MIDFKKMDEKDFVFINKTLSNKEDKAFSEFLKTRKTKKLKRRKLFKLNKNEPSTAGLAIGSLKK